jgi:hypothetical protein
MGDLKSFGISTKIGSLPASQPTEGIALKRSMSLNPFSKRKESGNGSSSTSSTKSANPFDALLGKSVVQPTQPPTLVDSSAFMFESLARKRMRVLGSDDDGSADLADVGKENVNVILSSNQS